MYFHVITLFFKKCDLSLTSVFSKPKQTHQKPNVDPSFTSHLVSLKRFDQVLQQLSLQIPLPLGQGWHPGASAVRRADARSAGR